MNDVYVNDFVIVKKSHKKVKMIQVSPIKMNKLANGFSASSFKYFDDDIYIDGFAQPPPQPTQPNPRSSGQFVSSTPLMCNDENECYMNLVSTKPNQTSSSFLNYPKPNKIQLVFIFFNHQDYYIIFGVRDLANSNIFIRYIAFKKIFCLK